MIIQCEKADEKWILEYIGNCYPSCLYLYLDLQKYGFENDSIEVFVQTNNNDITSILLKYYSCLHVFSRENSFNPVELAEFFATNCFTMLYCTEKTAEIVYMALSNETKKKTVITKGWVAKIERIDREPQGLAVTAEKEDFRQIIRLIYEDDDIGRSYKLNDLTKQLEDRNQEGYARNLVIKEGDQVIAHACTNAELDNIAIVAELVVRKEFRRKGYALEILRKICGDLLTEGKEVYSFYYSEESRRLHLQIGFKEICKWAKVVVS